MKPPKIYEEMKKRKKLEDELFYSSGDTYTAKLIMNGYITSATTYVNVNITLPKKLNKITEITCTQLNVEARGIKGYLNSTGGYYNFLDDNYSVTARKSDENNVAITLAKTTAFTNVDNNTPIVLQGYVTLKFN